MWPPISGSQVLLGPAREAAWRSEYNCSGRQDKGIFQPRISREDLDGIVFSGLESLWGFCTRREGWLVACLLCKGHLNYHGGKWLRVLLRYAYFLCVSLGVRDACQITAMIRLSPTGLCVITLRIIVYPGKDAFGRYVSPCL